MIDNFDIIRSHLTFESDYDCYIVHVLKRAKDDKCKSYGVNDTNRLLKTFYIVSLEYFDLKVPVIKDLCDSNCARAYILPQVRNNEDCLKELLKIVVDNLSNPTIKPDHLIRSAYCGYHGSRDKKWILDLDDDNMIEYKRSTGFPYDQVSARKWTPDEVLELVKKCLVAVCKSEDDAWMIPTKSGHCLVTSPFNLAAAHNHCTMLFQGVTKMQTGIKHTGQGKCEPIHKDINGWLIKDGMAMLYFRGSNEER